MTDKLEQLAKEYANPNLRYLETDAQYQHRLQDFIAGYKARDEEISKQDKLKYVPVADVEILLEALKKLQSPKTRKPRNYSERVVHHALKDYQASRGTKGE